MATLRKVLIMAGGTGGHVFPGLAVAAALQDQGVTVEWLGTVKGLEARLVPAAGIVLHLIAIAGLRGKGWLPLLTAPIRLLRAIWQAKRVMRRFQPDVVLGMGGFVSGPGGIAAWLLRRPLVIHEQNAIAGLTNQWLARIAAKVLEGFPDTFTMAPDKRAKIVTTGNPVRAEIANLPPPATRFAGRDQSAEPLRLLVVGGSLGAAAFNELVPQALAMLSASERPAVLHQAGEKQAVVTAQYYSQANVTAQVQPFIADMPAAYAWADIILCRAGALTVAELCAAGLGAIFVPYPYAVDDHQTANARYLVDQGGALLIQQKALTAAVLSRLIQQLALAPPQRYAMAQAAYQLRKIDATKQVVQVCEEVCT